MGASCVPSVHTYPALLGSPDLSQMDGSLLGFLFFSFFLSFPVWACSVSFSEFDLAWFKTVIENAY